MIAELSQEGDVMLDEDIIWLTTGLYEAFMAYGKKGMDAYLLYSHLVYTARRQKTNSVWAVDAYLGNGLSMGKTRLVAARKLLIKMGLIEISQNRNVDGTLQKSYTKVKTSRLWAFSPHSQNPPVDTSTYGQSATNALKGKGSALKENTNALVEVFEAARKAYPGSKLGKATEYKNFKKKHNDYTEAVHLLMPAILKQKQSAGWVKEGGAYIPMFSKWINQRRWELEVPVVLKDLTSADKPKRNPENIMCDKYVEENGKTYEELEAMGL